MTSFANSLIKMLDWLDESVRRLDPDFIGTTCFEEAFANQRRIEPRIRSLVLAMNRTGHFKTIASCQGHIGLSPWPCMSINHPYIYFKAKPEIYKIIYTRLEYFGARTKLKHGNVVLGLRMHSDEGVCMYIDLEYGKRWITRKQVDEDIGALSEILHHDIFEGLADKRRQEVIESNQGANKND